MKADKLYLVGFMGAGKTTVARALARRYPDSNARLARGHAGIYFITPDRYPMLGEPVDAPGLFLACGFSHGFKVSPAVLVPRPDSETLIEVALGLMPDRRRSWRLLDLGLGSGCLLLTLLREWLSR